MSNSAHHEQQAADTAAATGRSTPRELIPAGEPARGDGSPQALPARRRLLRGAAAAGLVAAAAAAEQLARPAAAQAGTDGDVVLGQVNTETTTTEIDNTTAGASAFFATATGTGGAAVNGQGDSGVGVQGVALFSTGTGVLAANSGGGMALQVQGTASFTNSGVLTVPAGHSSVTHSSFVLTKTSLVLATLQQHVAGVYVLAAVPNTTSNTFTVYLSKTVTAATKVAWFVIN